MTAKWMTLLFFLIGLTGAGLFGYSLAQQTLIQGQINDTMSVINYSILSTGETVKKTSAVLEPLTATTQSLAEIEKQEEAAVADLNAMNNHLADTAKTETGIINALTALNQATQSVGDKVSAMTQTTQQIDQATVASKTLAEREGYYVGTLNQLTSTSISELKTLNGKLEPLRLLP